MAQKFDNISDKQLKEAYNLETAVNEQRNKMKKQGFDLDSGFKKEKSTNKSNSFDEKQMKDIADYYKTDIEKVRPSYEMYKKLGYSQDQVEAMTESDLLAKDRYEVTNKDTDFIKDKYQKKEKAPKEKAPKEDKFKGVFNDLDKKEAEARKTELSNKFKGKDLDTAISELKQGRPYGEVLSGTITYEKEAPKDDYATDEQISEALADYQWQITDKDTVGTYAETIAKHLGTSKQRVLDMIISESPTKINENSKMSVVAGLEPEEETNNKFVYQFPKLSKDEIAKAKEYGLNVEATMLKDNEYNTKGDMVLSGDEENLRNFASEVLSYELNPDYTYKYQDYDFEDLEEQGYLSRGENTEEDRVYSEYDDSISVSREVYDSFAESKGGWEKTEDEMIDYLANNDISEEEIENLYDYLVEYNLHKEAEYLINNGSLVKEIKDLSKGNKRYTFEEAIKDLKEGKDFDIISDSVYKDEEPDFEDDDDYYARFDEVHDEKVREGNPRPYSSMLIDLVEDGYLDEETIKEDIWRGLGIDGQKKVIDRYNLLEDDEDGRDINDLSEEEIYDFMDYLTFDDLIGWEDDDWYYDILNNRDLRYDYPL